MADTPITTSAFNDGYIAEQFEAFRADPTSVDESWRQFFRLASQFALGAAVATTPGDGDPELPRIAASAASLAQNIRLFGHLAVQLDPLGTPPLGAAELTPEYHKISATDLARVPAGALGYYDDPRFRTAADVIAMLRRRYSSRLALEVMHVPDETERLWFRTILREEKLTRPLSATEKMAVLSRLTQVDGLERFLGRAYQGKKRFSIEGTDALVPMLDTAISEASEQGTTQVVVGMAHRGRLNVLTNVMGKPYESLFSEFEGRHGAAPDSETGDVKYHMGYEGQRTLPSGATVGLTLVPNPSHLEFANPVINGVARARQRITGTALERDPKSVLTVCVHGDAAFIGEGVVAETFNMSRLRGYEVGGTLHIIANNQVGFTTDPIDARSTHYASDLAKGFDVPIVHVNADDAEACVMAVRIAIAYRTRFGKDFLIDLVGYRRWGHNETDEPLFTQPELYARIKAHPTPRQVWGSRLVKEGVLTKADVDTMDTDFAKSLEEIFDSVRKTPEAHEEHLPNPAAPAPVHTAVDAGRLKVLNDALLAWPKDLVVNPRLAKTLERRREGLEKSIDWGHAESLAFGSLIQDGVHVRLTGQDVERGTFSHRQAVLHDANTGRTYTALQHVPDAKASMEIVNSPLSETAVMGFEYGFSTAAPDTLVCWVAQFGDFANVAAPIIDQFMVADRAKWHQDNGLVLLLPHGYEGQGPEHSSARLERFLQLCAEGNMTVAYPSTPAQYFHLLRRQALRESRRPMVLMQPKSMLRLSDAMSGIADLSAGAFQPVIDDATAAGRASMVTRIVACTGKIYHEIRAANPGEHIALVRIEELYPWPSAEISAVIDRYPNLTEVIWAQEETRNAGAWTFAEPRLRMATGNALGLRYVGRPERASPAEGYEAAHKAEQARIIAEALAPAAAAPAPVAPPKARKASATR
ncbi:MAG: 2-oxoglutarate dehydrogenase E1 component [Gemmatimonadaceae bacterium]|nr:2-oxoglutarate dehydrogenase E1 component [Gemmatimonadaceae bacterium]